MLIELIEVGAGWIGFFLNMGEPVGQPQLPQCHPPTLH